MPFGRLPATTPVQFADGAQNDAFQRLRVSPPETLFDSTSQYDGLPLLWEEVVTGTASTTHLPNRSAVQMTVGATANDSIYRQTREYFRYQPGKSQFVAITFDMEELENSCRFRVGYFDGENGVFFQRSNGVNSIVIRSKASGSVVDTVIEQPSWSVDPMTGTGPSNKILDTTKAQIFVIDLQWLGVGRVRCGFSIDGLIYVAHENLHANRVGGVYMTTANLPLRYELTQVAGGAGDSITAICGTVISEGGAQIKTGFPFSVGTGATLKTVTATPRIPILSIRPALTFNSVANRAKYIIQQISTLAVAQNAFVELVYNGTLTGASFGAVSASSGVEFDTAATAVTGGIVISSFFVAGSNQSPSANLSGIVAALPFTIDAAGLVADRLSVCATRVGGSGTLSIGATMSWEEIR